MSLDGPHGRGMRSLKGWRHLLGVSIVVLLAVSVAACCSSNRYRLVSGTEFQELAGAAIGSAVHTRFIGATGDRAYLSVWSAMPSSMGGGEDVCSCALSDLPPEVVAQIRSGQNPWGK